VQARIRTPGTGRAGSAAVCAVAVSVAVLVLTSGGIRARDAMVVAAAIPVGRLLSGRRSVRARFLPLAGALLPALGVPVVLAAALAAGLVDLGRPQLAMVCAATAVAAAGPWRRGRATPPVRVAVLGARSGTAALCDQLARLCPGGHTVVGYLDEVRGVPGRTDGPGVGPRWLGRPDRLVDVVTAGGVELLLVPSEEARRFAYEALAGHYLTVEVQVMELGVFAEEAFGMVAVDLIEPVWLRHVLRARSRRAGRIAERAFDLAVCLLVAVPAVPVILLLAALVKLDGGPALYRQERVGYRGRRFEILKLRSMCPGDGGACWSSPDDPRVTRIGRLMRRTHLDELPQLLNVLRGDMSIVGPRPEQPPLVQDLAATIPYYHVRHLVKPGVTGWAQVRCGYAGSAAGSVWKAGYDLYYVKHRSVRLDALIVLETVRTLVFDRQWQDGSRHPSFAAWRTTGAIPGIPGIPGIPAPRDGRTPTRV
jgi:lipopolysaccharide/colanic/teichoic acid biosynthesis glycosyltransferase